MVSKKRERKERGGGATEKSEVVSGENGA